jgi:hypothetical protein
MHSQIGAAAAACEKPVDRHLGSGSPDVDAQIGSQRRNRATADQTKAGYFFQNLDLIKTQKIIKCETTTNGA